MTVQNVFRQAWDFVSRRNQILLLNGRNQPRDALFRMVVDTSIRTGSPCLKAVQQSTMISSDQLEGRIKPLPLSSPARLRFSYGI